MKAPTIYIIGVGPGDPLLLTALAKQKIESAAKVIASKRLAEKMKTIRDDILAMAMKDYLAFIHQQTQQGESVCVLVSGDVGWFSAAKGLSKNIFPSSNLQLINGISSFQYLLSKIGKSHDGICIASAHGRDLSIIPLVSYNEKVFAFTGGQVKAHNIIKELVDSGLSDVDISVGENLSDQNERIIQGKAFMLDKFSFADLCVMYIENKNYADRFKRIRDVDFIRGKTPMTKENIRCLSIAALEIRPDDTIADIGAGTGSVSVEIARKAHQGTVYAFEKNGEALNLIKLNRDKFKTFNIKIMPGPALENLNRLPKIDKVFIGGSGGELKKIIDYLLRQNPKVRFVINTVTLETLTEFLSICNIKNLKFEVNCINSSWAEKMGNYTLMKADNPIYIISAEASSE